MLTDQQKLDVRRYAGYPLTANTPVDNARDFAYGWVSPGVWQTLYERLNNLSATEQSTLISVYLTNLATLEQAIVASVDNLDTQAAAVWVHNKSEVQDKSALFDQWRRRMCAFIGIPPGPSLGSGGSRITRG